MHLLRTGLTQHPDDRSLGVAPHDGVVDDDQALALDHVTQWVQLQSDPELADRLRGTGENFWDEFGTTTGRPRRVGWFDAVAARYAAEINGISSIALTKLDVLDGLSELKLCTGYQLRGQYTDILPMGADDIADCQPVYETMAGWTDSTVGITDYAKLPPQARAYLERIAQVTGVPIHLISTSPDRDHTIVLRNPFH